MLNPPVSELQVCDVAVHMLNCVFAHHPSYSVCNSVLLSELSYLVATSNPGSICLLTNESSSNKLVHITTCHSTSMKGHIPHDCSLDALLTTVKAKIYNIQ
jgi:hypothetical protein